MDRSRKWIVPVRVTFTDTPIPAVNQYLGSLLSRDLPSCIYGFALRAKMARHALSATLADRPLTVSRHDVLTLAGHGHCIPCVSLAK